MYENIELLYKELGSMRKLAKHFSCRISKVSKILKEKGVDLTQHRGKNRIHFFNESFLLNINDPIAMYWLGFIFADGWVSKGFLGIDLAEKDKHMLEQFKKDINTSAPIFKRIVKNSKRNAKYNDSINYGIHISSVKLVKELGELGIIQNKSLTVKFPQFALDNKFLNIFVRGYFDGDGGFLFQKGQLCMHFRGTKEFLTVLKNVFSEKFNLSTNKNLTFDSNIYRLRYNGNNICNKICEWMYADIPQTNRYLERKYKLYHANVV